MKKFLVNIFGTTGISLLLLSIIAIAFRAHYIYVQTVFQIFGVNAVVHVGLFFIGKLELKYALTEALLDMMLIIFVLLGFGKIFDWYTSTPVWVLLPVGVVMYMISIVLNLFRLKHEAREINALIEKRNDRKAGES